MKEKDKKETMEIVCEGINQVIMPVLGEILETQQEMKGDVKESKQDIKELKIDVKEVKKTQADHSDQLENINRKLDSTITRVDKHEVLMGK